MSAADRLTESETITAAATEGPWGLSDDGDYEDERAVLYPNGRHMFTGEGGYVGGYAEGPDAVFIVHARTALPKRDAALRAVLALHQPIVVGIVGRHPSVWRCSECLDWLGEGDQPQRPCATVRAIEDTLA